MVDFRKLMFSKMTGAQIEEYKRKEAYVKKVQKEYSEKSDKEIVVDFLHCWHNAAFTGVNGKVNGYGLGDPVYDSAIVYLVMPEVIARLAKSVGMPEVQEALRDKKHVRQIKCPMIGCTGYVELR